MDVQFLLLVVSRLLLELVFLYLFVRFLDIIVYLEQLTTHIVHSVLERADLLLMLFDVSDQILDFTVVLVDKKFDFFERIRILIFILRHYNRKSVMQAILFSYLLFKESIRYT